MAIRCEETINSYKKDYVKLLSILKEKDADMSVIRKKLDEKDDQIASLNDKLLSVIVLEHKIKKIDQKFKNDLDKNNEMFNSKIKEIENTRKFNPNFFKRINDYENSKRKLENSLLVKNLKNNSILKKKEIELDEKKTIHMKLNESLFSVKNEKEKLKERISCRNKEIHDLEIKNKMFF